MLTTIAATAVALAVFAIAAIVLVEQWSRLASHIPG
jgi:hypothetical protein